MVTSVSPEKIFFIALALVGLVVVVLIVSWQLLRLGSSPKGKKDSLQPQDLQRALREMEIASVRARSIFEETMLYFPSPVYVLDDKERFLYVNAAAEMLGQRWGYSSRTQLEGHTLQQAEAYMPQVLQQSYHQALQSRKVMRVEFVKQELWYEATFTPIHDGGVEVLQVVIFLQELALPSAAPVQEELALRPTEPTLKWTDERHQAMLNHRVNNVLGMASNLLQLQAMDVPEASARQVLHHSLLRLQALALFYTQELQTHEPVPLVAFEVYIPKLVVLLQEGFAGKVVPVVKLQLDNVQLPLKQSVPLGLLVNELLLHNFEAAQQAEPQPIALQLSCSEGYCSLVMAGLIALPAAGQALVQGFVNQLQGQLEYEGQGESILRLGFAMGAPAA